MARLGWVLSPVEPIEMKYFPSDRYFSDFDEDDYLDDDFSGDDYDIDDDSDFWRRAAD